MPTQIEVPQIIKEIQRRLDDAAKRGNVHLAVNEQDSKLDDDWLYVCLTPTQEGENASDHADLMSEIEKVLHEEGTDKVLLIPTLVD